MSSGMKIADIDDGGRWVVETALEERCGRIVRAPLMDALIRELGLEPIFGRRPGGSAPG